MNAPKVGIVIVDKPLGWTSHDVVGKIRRLAGQKRVGHAGTLDPLATGVLPVLLGRATRLADFVGAGRKRYTAEVKLGEATATDDAEGEVTERKAVPSFSDTELEAVLTGFRGEIQQVPPAYSAIKVQGQRAYAQARRGAEVALPPRPVTIYSLDLIERSNDALVIDVRCSRGTYIRSLARDIARALGTVGHLTSLVRTEVGPFRLLDAHSIEAIGSRGVPSVLLPPDQALPDAPRVDTDEGSMRKLLSGLPVPANGLNADLVRVYDPTGTTMFMVGTADGTTLRPRILLTDVPGGETR